MARPSQKVSEKTLLTPSVFVGRRAVIAAKTGKSASGSWSNWSKPPLYHGDRRDTSAPEEGQTHGQYRIVTTTGRQVASHAAAIERFRTDNSGAHQLRGGDEYGSRAQDP